MTDNNEISLCPGSGTAATLESVDLRYGSIIEVCPHCQQDILVLDGLRSTHYPPSDEDEETECDGTDCDDPYCEAREEYEVEFTIIVKGRLMAHSEEQADELASSVSMDLSAQAPSSVSEEWTDRPEFYGTEYSLDSESLRAARRAETAAYMAKVGADA
jgi:hypothetical protein